MRLRSWYQTKNWCWHLKADFATSSAQVAIVVPEVVLVVGVTV